MANLPWASSLLPYAIPCCECPVACCDYSGTGTGDGGSAVGTIDSATAVSFDVTTTNSSATLALGLTGTMTLTLQSGATVTLTWTTDGFTSSASITGLTPDSSGSGTATYTIPATDCYTIELVADSGPGSWTSMYAYLDITSDLDINCDSLTDNGFTPGGGGP